MSFRKISLTENFLNFYGDLNQKEQEKLDYCMYIVENNNRPPNTIFRSIRNSYLFEIRFQTRNRQIRVLCIFTGGNWKGELILLHGFEKKNNKNFDLNKEIDKAYKVLEAFSPPNISMNQ